MLPFVAPVQDRYKEWCAGRKRRAALLHALKEANWVDMGRVASRTHGTKKHIFCAPEHARVSKSDLRDMVEG